MTARWEGAVDIARILEILPHRFPMLLVDRVVEIEPGVRILAYKNVTMNEDFFNGHFPGRPVMPGVLIIEALAQASALLAHASSDFEKDGHDVFLVGLDDVRFRRPVVPGDRLDLEVTLLRQRSGIFKHQGVASVEGNRVAECVLMAAVRDRETQPT